METRKTETSPQRVLEYAPPGRTKALGAIALIALGLSLACPPMFVAYVLGAFGFHFYLLVTILVMGISSSAVAVATTKDAHATAIVALLALILNMVPTGVIAVAILSGH